VTVLSDEVVIIKLVSW